MVSKANEDFPEPLRPVITVKLFRGISTSMFLRLCWRAPCTVIRSSIVVNERKGRNFYCPAGCIRSAICDINYSILMPHCRTCGGRLRRVHRSFAERFLYMGVFECPECKDVKRIARRYTYHLGDEARCPLCGTYRLRVLAERDHIDRMLRNPVNAIKR